jgi:hypothetical protein
VTSSEGSSARRGVVHTHTNKRFNSDHRGPFRGIVTTPLALGERLLAFTLSRLYPEPPGRFGGQYGIRETLPSMTPEEFRRIALSLPEAQEVYRRGRSHFRVERKAFATLEGPGDAVATVNLTPDQQSMFMHEAPKAFVPVPGGRGRLGSTSVLLGSVTSAQLQDALGGAWQNVASKSLLQRINESGSTIPARSETGSG